MSIRGSQRWNALFARTNVYLALLAMALCLPVCLSVTNRYGIETAWWIELVVVGMAAFFHPYYDVLGCLQNRGTFLCTCVPNSRKFRQRTTIVATCCQQSLSTIELCWLHLQQSTNHLPRILFATRPSIVTQNIARKSAAPSSCVS